MGQKPIFSIWSEVKGLESKLSLTNGRTSNVNRLNCINQSQDILQPLYKRWSFGSLALTNWKLSAEIQNLNEFIIHYVVFVKYDPSFYINVIMWGKTPSCCCLTKVANIDNSEIFRKCLQSINILKEGHGLAG